MQRLIGQGTNPLKVVLEDATGRQSLPEVERCHVAALAVAIAHQKNSNLAHTSEKGLLKSGFVL